MNALIPALMAASAPALAAYIARRAPASEARWIGVIGASVATLTGLIASAVTRQGDATWAWGALALRFDAVSASLTAPMALAMLAIILAAPSRQLNARWVSGALALLSVSLLGLLVDNALLLLLAEALGALCCVVMVQGARRARVVALAMTAVVALLCVATLGLGLAGVALLPLDALNATPSAPTGALGVATGALLLASITRLGVLPASGWLAGAMTHEDGAPMLSAMLPFGGVAPLLYAVEPLAQQLAPQLAHHGVTAILAASLLAAALALVQERVGRAFGFVLSSVVGLIVAGALDPHPLGLVGAEVLWASTLLGAAGFGLCVVLCMARVSADALRAFGGLSASAPRLGVLFLVLGAALVGIPGTSGFVGAELILNGSVSHALAPVLLMVGCIGLQGLVVMRLFMRVFYGDPGALMGPLELLTRERVALLALAGLLVLGGLAPRLLPLLAAR